MIRGRRARLTRPARQLVLARTVLCPRATAQWLWQVAELGVEAGVEALEEAVASGILREEEAGAGRPSRYHFAHEWIRDVGYTELAEERCQDLHHTALALSRREGSPPAALAYLELDSEPAEALVRYRLKAG